MGGERAGDKLVGRGLVGGWDGKASCGGDDLMLGPCFREVVQASPEGSQLPLDLYGAG